jgi:hypothetical protein
MNRKSPVLAFAIAAAALIALTASVPAYADGCNQSTYVEGTDNQVINNCTIVKNDRSVYAPVYDDAEDAYPAPVYRRAPPVVYWGPQIVRGPVVVGYGGGYGRGGYGGYGGRR